MHQQLLGHLLGALDDDEHARVDARLEHDAEYCRELARWRQRLGPIGGDAARFRAAAGLGGADVPLCCRVHVAAR